MLDIFYPVLFVHTSRAKSLEKALKILSSGKTGEPFHTWHEKQNIAPERPTDCIKSYLCHNDSTQFMPLSPEFPWLKQNKRQEQRTAKSLGRFHICIHMSAHHDIIMIFSDSPRSNPNNPWELKSRWIGSNWVPLIHQLSDSIPRVCRDWCSDLRGSTELFWPRLVSGHHIVLHISPSQQKSGTSVWSSARKSNTTTTTTGVLGFPTQLHCHAFGSPNNWDPLEH